MRQLFFLLVAAMACAAGAETVAFYPFTEQASGSALSTAAANVKNAVDETLYPGRAFGVKVYGSVTPVPQYSDDVPGAFLYSGVSSDQLLVASYQSVQFPDFASGEGYPLVTNETALTVDVSYRQDNGAGSLTPRTRGSSMLVLQGLDAAISGMDNWTIECFIKHESSYTGQGTFCRRDNVGVTSVHTCTTKWNRMRSMSSYNIEASSNGDFNFGTCGWKHLALVRSGTTIRVYLDYTIVKEFTSAKVAPGEGNAADLIFGDTRTNYPNMPFYGKIAAVRVTNEALTQQEFLYAEQAQREHFEDKILENDYEVPPEGENVGRLIVRGTVTITGGALGFTRGIQVESGSATLRNAGVDLRKQGVKFVAEAGTTLQMEAPISGSDAFTVETKGTTVFAAANTFTGEMTVTGGGVFRAANDAAFGTTDAKTILRSSRDDVYGVATQIRFDGITTSEAFDLYSDDNAGAAHLYFTANTKNVFFGPLTGQRGRGNMRFEAGSETVFSNKLTNLAYMSNWGSSTAKVSYNDTVSAHRYSYPAGTYAFNARVANFTPANYGVIASSETVFKMGCTNVFAASDDARAAYVGATLRFDGAGTFDLNGFDQRVASIEGTANGVISSTEPATLHVDSLAVSSNSTGGRSTFYGSAVGAVSIVSEGPIPLELTGKSTSTGELVATNGARICLASGASWGGSAIRASGAGSTIEIAESMAVGEETELVAEDGGSFAIAEGMNVMVKRLKAPDGTVYTDTGTYGAPGSGAKFELAWLSGTGILTITARAAQSMVWHPTDTSTAAGTAMGTAANWVDGKIPDFEQGFDSALFPEGTVRATVDVPVSISGGIVALPPEGAFTFAAGGAALSLGSDGLKLECTGEEAGVRTITNEAPVRLTGAQVWTLPGSGSVVVQKGSLSGSASSSLHLSGNADVHLMGDNSAFQGALFLDGEGPYPGCVVHVWDDQALGCGSVNVSNPYQGTANTKVSFLQFHGDRKIGNPLAFTLTDAKKFGVDAGARVAFTNFADFNGIVRPVTGRGAEVVFSGGVRTVCYRQPPPPGGKVVVTNTPCAIASYNGQNSSAKQSDLATLEIWTSGNSYASNSDYGFEYIGNILIDLHAEKAISRAASTADGGYMPKIRFGNVNNLWNHFRLNGFNQECAYLEENLTPSGYLTADSHAVVESDSLAQLDVLQSCRNVRELTRVAWEGAAGLTLRGTTTLRITGTESSTTGRLEVAGGLLELGAKWPNVSEVAVHAGSFTALESNLFSQKTTVLSLESGATFNLAGTDQVVQSIRVDGVQLRQKTYKAGDAALKGILQGAGTLTAFGSGPGTLLVIR